MKIPQSPVLFFNVNFQNIMSDVNVLAVKFQPVYIDLSHNSISYHCHKCWTLIHCIHILVLYCKNNFVYVNFQLYAVVYNFSIHFHLLYVKLAYNSSFLKPRGTVCFVNWRLWMFPMVFIFETLRATENIVYIRS